MRTILRIFHQKYLSHQAGKKETLSLLNKMDKISVRKKSRRNEVGQKTEASLVFFQVICPGLPGYPGSLFLSTNNKRYLFNCSEGTQRLCVEHCVSRSLASLEHIFLTQKSWRCMGGLGGMCLAIKDSGSPDVTLHGPEGSTKIYEMTKGFICLQNFNILPQEITSSNLEPYTDSTLTVEYLHLSKNNPTHNTQSVPAPEYWNTVYKGFDANGKLISKFVPEEIEYDENVYGANSNIVYILTIKGRKGKLCLDKCLDKGVPPGPLLGKLKQGEDIVLENGETVFAADVRDQNLPDKKFIVIDLPSLDYMDSLLCAPIWDSIRKEDKLQGMFHFTSSEILLSKEYQTWMNSFNGNIEHHMINDLNSKGYGTLGVATFAEKLSILDPNIFQPLHSDIYFDEQERHKSSNQNWIFHRTADRIVVRGFPPEHVTTLSPILPSLVKEELESLQDFKEVFSRTRDKVCVETNSSTYPSFVFLGTGSSVPSKYRAPSAILVELRPKEYMIMDCGEGTIIQLYRYFGIQGMKEFLRGLKGIYISHLHADHHLGLIGIIKERQRLNIGEAQPLYIAAPTKLSSFFNQYHVGFEGILENLIQVQNEHALILHADAVREPDEAMIQFKEALGLKVYDTCRAVHCVNSYCVSFVTTEGFHFIYTGDTRPNSGLIDLSKNIHLDLLIHEATMEHIMLEDAIKKRHSTFTEAINGGIALNAKATVLTHFSQRYPKFPFFDELVDHPNVGYAFDFMRVDRHTFNHTHHLMDALKTIFKEDYELMAARKEIFEYKMKSLESTTEEKNDSGEGEESETKLKDLYSKLDHPSRKIKRLKLD
ncbi:ribonuclease Z, mitochondrial [Lepeophtheirus salmonis]|uniref:ribonuclease Z, mitochondrial n=1 Tax=Lepeophtheirus salmonis TaxID=72036 RepID=UPI001AEA6D86|nr:ribonuclease Z, mitochondrial-like [Lepeophtheirus salmonis]